jgi:hypothetical protein
MALLLDVMKARSDIFLVYPVDIDFENTGMTG